MADVITRFKLETTQYDSALRDSSKALSDYTKQAAIAGEEFGKFTQKNVEAARALGNIATSATNTKDKVKELVGAYNDVAKAYNSLTEEQKKSDFGKAMSESLSTLQGRIRSAKQEMNAVPGVLDNLASKFTVNIDAIKLFNLGLKAAESALSVAKDAFFASEATVDEWGRVTASAQSVYEGFLNAINTGDISGYLNRIDEIVDAARKAYDELDRLGTMKTIQAPQTEKQNAENTRMRTMLMTGRYIAPAAGSGLKATMAEGTLLTPEQMRRIEQQLQGGMQTIVKLTGNELNQTGRAIDAYYNKLAKQNGMTMAEFKKGVSSMSEFDKRIAGAKRYAEYERAHTTYDERTGIAHRDKTVNPDEIYKAWSVFRVDKQGQNSYNDLVGLIRQQQQQTSQMYSTIGQAYRTINRAEGTTVRSIMGGGSGGGGGKGGGKTGTEIDYAPDSIKAQQAEVQRLTKLWQGAGEAVRNDYKKQLEEAQYTLDKMTGKEKFDPNKLRQIQGTVLQAPSTEIKNPFESMGKMKSEVVMELGAEQIKVDENTLHTLIKDAIQNSVNGMDLQFDILGKQIAKGIDVPDSAWQSIIDQYNDLREQMGLEPITVNIQTGNLEKLSNDAKVVKASFKDAASAVGNLGSALSGLDDPGAKIAGTVAQAIANIALAFSSADLKEGEKGNVWYWIAATAAGLATMVSTISSIHAATKYAEGGMIKGNSYSGDNILGVNNSTGELVGLNAGEIVLNRAAQGNLLSQGSGGGFNGQIVGRIEGENIVLVANRYFKRTGQGEILTWKN